MQLWCQNIWWLISWGWNIQFQCPCQNNQMKLISPVSTKLQNTTIYITCAHIEIKLSIKFHKHQIINDCLPNVEGPSINKANKKTLYMPESKGKNISYFQEFLWVSAHSWFKLMQHFADSFTLTWGLIDYPKFNTIIFPNLPVKSYSNCGFATVIKTWCTVHVLSPSLIMNFKRIYCM